MTITNVEFQELVDILDDIDPNVMLGEQAYRILLAGYRRIEPQGVVLTILPINRGTES